MTIKKTMHKISNQDYSNEAVQLLLKGSGLATNKESNIAKGTANL